MTEQQILDRMRMDLELSGHNESTIKTYLNRVQGYQAYFSKPADQLGENELREYLHHQLKDRGLMASTVNNINSSLRYLYDITLDCPINRRRVPFAKRIRRLPILPDKDELETIFTNTRELRYRAIFMTIYGSGLRVSEAANLLVTDIDSKNMRMFIRQGKGGKDRYALLPQRTLCILREYYKAYKPKKWLFINKIGGHITAQSIETALHAAVESSGIQKHITVHTLRHCFATHLLNEGKNIYQIKRLLGHVRLDSTTWYLHLSDSETMCLVSPLDSSSVNNGGLIPPKHNG